MFSTRIFQKNYFSVVNTILSQYINFSVDIEIFQNKLHLHALKNDLEFLSFSKNKF